MLFGTSYKDSLAFTSFFVQNYMYQFYGKPAYLKKIKGKRKKISSFYHCSGIVYFY